MKKQYKIQLPKGKKVTMTNVDFEDGVMTVNVELENRENFHEAIHNEVCGVFGKINNQLKEVLKHNGSKKEKIEEMAKESIKELEKDCPDIWDKMIQEYGEVICGKTEQKYEPKDGDFVYFNCGTIPTIAIFARTYFDCAIITYASLGMLSTTYKKTISYLVNNLRPATEEEKKLIVDKLAEKGKKWNPNTKQIEDVRWRAEVGETFFYIDTDGRINSMNRDDFHYLWKRYDSLSERLEDERMGNVEYMLWKKGNYFKTREAAEKVAEQIREIFKNSKAV